MAKTTVGIIGGTGLYSLKGLSQVQEIQVETPFGKPSSPLTIAELGETRLVFLARHGYGHVYLPSEVNYRANIYALKLAGAAWCISVSAVGSLQSELKPGHIVIPDQIIDRSKNRENTFFGNGMVAHVAFAEPYCPVLRSLLFESATAVCSEYQSVAHNGGTYICMEGPAFSTKAESHMYRAWNGSIIGMTAIPEAKLAREAEIAFASLSLVTDYDCWKDDGSAVDGAEVLRIMSENVILAQDILHRVVPILCEHTPSELARNALAAALVTNPESVPASTLLALKPLLARYLT